MAYGKHQSAFSRHCDRCLLPNVTILGVTLLSSALIAICPNLAHLTVYDPDRVAHNWSQTEHVVDHVKRLLDKRTLRSCELPLLVSHPWTLQSQPALTKEIGKIQIDNFQ
jgi:hypothetical protein